MITVEQIKQVFEFEMKKYDTRLKLLEDRILLLENKD